MLDTSNRANLAYIIGVALGDGNLSNPNGRAVRLRITCDTKYPNLIVKIENAIKIVAPHNKVGRIIRKGNAIDVYCYSNGWEEVLGWKASAGPKLKQAVSVPLWIMSDVQACRHCLCGLIETDGSVYRDRKYLAINFVTQIPSLAKSVDTILKKLGYIYSKQELKLSKQRVKYTFRIHKKAQEFIKDLGINKT